MRCPLPLLLFITVASACTPEPAPIADLVPAGALAALLPDSVGAYGAVGDEVYRGYFADSAGALALVTVARTYQRGAAMMALNVSSLDDPGRYRAIVEAGGGRTAPDSVIQADAVLRDAASAGWVLYTVSFGWLLLHPNGRVVETKSLFSKGLREALWTVDLHRLAALAEERTTVDSTFVRAVSQPRPHGPQPVEEEAVVG